MKRLITVLAIVVLTARLGVVTYDGHRESYYNLPMKKVVENAQQRGFYADYWEREDGCKMYGPYVIVAADYNLHPYGSVVDTSHGAGIVLDTGTFKDRATVDMAVTW